MAASRQHSYGAKCRLAPVHRAHEAGQRPPITAQFFYSSLIPIDDPLSTGSVTAGNDSRSSKGQLRPFAAGDQNALEKAWLGLASAPDRRTHQEARRLWNRHITPTHQRGATEEPADALVQQEIKTALDKRALLVRALAVRHFEKHGAGYEPQDVSVPAESLLPTSSLPVCCSQLLADVCEELGKTFCTLLAKNESSLDPESVVKDVVIEVSRMRLHINGDEQAQATLEKIDTASPIQPSASSLISPLSATGTQVPGQTATNGIEAIAARDTPDASTRRARSTSIATPASSRTQTPAGTPSRTGATDSGITGTPFVRVGSPEVNSSPVAGSFPRLANPASKPPSRDGLEAVETESRSGTPDKRSSKRGEPPAKVPAYAKESMEVAVGISRLHMVSFPTLQMKPIYWSPVNDVAVVMRVTWFYRDTMLPVPPAVANQLEAGYHELCPWTETWSDEVRCAIDVGPLGEEKVSHRLWPKDPDSSDGSSLEPRISSEPSCAARCFQGEAAAEGSIEPLKKAGATSPTRPFSNYHVLYKNESVAYLLKPSLKPNAYYGRRPLQKIMRGVSVGVPVVRGFDRMAWERIHHRRQAPNTAGVSAASQSHESSGQDVCPGCKADKEKGQVRDLILVAHGIGQKFAERVESYHFTHAVNGFRRAVNVELGNPAVQQVVREGQNGMMILPLNWRLGLSFEDGGPMREEDKDDYSPEGFALKDIEPDTIPAIRSMISDVMFDIPFYMSHHKGKMIKALVTEANRVYRLWCRNNPGFAEHGRVHMIGHSLGSAMALDVLSRQPTHVPKLNLSQPEPDSQFFEFDTSNLFLVGSPAGFFLLLERGTLIPRRGRSKAGADPNDSVASNIVGEAGSFGCLAVDNIYNVLAKEDPIAYLLNGSVDAPYAASLKTAYVPSTTPSLLKYLGDAMRGVVPGAAPAAAPLASEPERPAALRLPSQLELEVHDFTREEIAEKKAFLLNDNGQIDWFLRSSGGPLELQYLNMLSAHTSYWTNMDFIRMLCVEVGRKPGRASTLPSMRAVKATKRVMK